MPNEHVTGTPDQYYDLISVSYHAMHGAWNHDQHMTDAEATGDEHLADFFRDVATENAERRREPSSC